MFILIAGCLCKYLYLYVHILVIGLLSNDTCTLLLMNYVSTKGLTWLMEYSHCGTMYVLIIWNMEIVKQEIAYHFSKRYLS